MSESVELLITLPFDDELITRLQTVSEDVHITVRKASRVEDIPRELWAQTEILYTNYVLPQPEQAPKLKWIQFHWSGVDDVLNEPIAKKPGLKLSTISGASATQMAEYVVSMMLALGHRHTLLMEHQKRSEWPSGRWEKFKSVELRDSTVGIVGYGSIGRQVARLLQPFGAIILATKRDAQHPEDRGYVPKDQGDPSGNLFYRLYPFQALGSMLRECDFIVVTVPKTPETVNLIGANEFSAIKPSAYLVDVSRGGVVDHEVLIEALEQKKIAGAALDVFPQEPLAPESPLWQLPNVIISPHIAGFSAHYDQRAVELFKRNLHNYLTHLPLYNRINLETGY